MKLQSDFFNSKIIDEFSKKEQKDIEKYPLLYFNHQRGFLLSNFQHSNAFKKQFKILGSSKIDDGREIISMIEHQKYPWFGVQFHPEKIIFEHDENLNLNKNNKSFNINRKLGDYFYSMIKENYANKNKYLDNDSVLEMRKYFTSVFDHKYVDETYTWNYPSYIERLQEELNNIENNEFPNEYLKIISRIVLRINPDLDKNEETADNFFENKMGYKINIKTK